MNPVPILRVCSLFVVGLAYSSGSQVFGQSDSTAELRQLILDGVQSNRNKLKHFEVELVEQWSDMKATRNLFERSMRRHIWHSGVKWRQEIDTVVPVLEDGTTGLVETGRLVPNTTNSVYDGKVTRVLDSYAKRAEITAGNEMEMPPDEDLFYSYRVFAYVSVEQMLEEEDLSITQAANECLLIRVEHEGRSVEAVSDPSQGFVVVDCVAKDAQSRIVGKRNGVVVRNIGGFVVTEADDVIYVFNGSGKASVAEQRKLTAMNVLSHGTELSESVFDIKMPGGTFVDNRLSGGVYTVPEEDGNNSAKASSWRSWLILGNALVAIVLIAVYLKRRE